MQQFDELATLQNPEIFAINRLPSCSDHLFYSSNEAMRQQNREDIGLSLDGRWRFHYADCLADRPADFFLGDGHGEGWGEIAVPANIELCGYGMPHYVNTMYPWDGIEKLQNGELPARNSVGSYLRTIELPDSFVGKQLLLEFEGVQSAFAVWVNGSFVGYSEDSFTTHRFDATSLLHSGTNTVAVRVYKYSTASWLEDQDYWRLSGIFRSVSLLALPSTHLVDLRVDTVLDDGLTHAAVTARVKLAGAPCTATAQLVAPDGTECASAELCGDTLSMAVERPSLWSAEHPNLYELIITLTAPDGTVVEVTSQPVGLRRLEMRDKVYYINNKRIVFNGVNRHEFSHCRGRAVNEQEMLWDIECLKRNNINAVRTSHYPNNSRFYDLCDRYGLYVIDEANLETHGTWQKMGAVEQKPDTVLPDDKPEWREACLDRARSMLERDKNHPCVVIWSCGNESYGGKTIWEMAELFRELDGSRAVHYEGVFNDRRYNDSSDFESRMYSKAADVEQYLQDNPTKPFILCEYAHAMGNSVGALHKYTELARKYPLYQGGFIWDYIDQAIIKTNRYGDEFLAYGGDFADRPTDYHFCGNGLVFADRTETPRMQEVRHCYAPFAVTITADGAAVRNDTLFTDLADYTLVWTAECDGHETLRVEQRQPLAPGASIVIALPFAAEAAPHETLSITLAIQLAADTDWSEAGYTVASGQLVCEAVPQLLPAPPVTVVEGDVNIGIHGNDWSLVFAKNMGTVISCRKGCTELLEGLPMPTFWRATTDNDRGNGLSMRCAQWKIASLYALPTDCRLEQGNGCATVSFDYDLNTMPAARCTVSYCADGNGRVTVTLQYKGTQGLPDMPLFGMQYSMSADFDRVEWFANGPDENYIDRMQGARLCRFATTPTTDLTHYLLPQECGNRTGVQELTVTDKAGRGLRITAVGLLEASVLPYTAHELESAWHKHDLPAVHHTILRLAQQVCGVGGDDSWGAPVHSEYLLDSAVDRKLQFVMELI